MSIVGYWQKVAGYEVTILSKKGIYLNYYQKIIVFILIVKKIDTII
jgi:hypothetical protein